MEMVRAKTVRVYIDWHRVLNRILAALVGPFLAAIIVGQTVGNRLLRAVRAPPTATAFHVVPHGRQFAAVYPVFVHVHQAAPLAIYLTNDKRASSQIVLIWLVVDVRHLQSPVQTFKNID